MLRIKTVAVMAALAMAGSVCASLPAAAQPAQTDALNDPALKGPEVVAFIGLKPGDQVADVFAGRFVRALSQAVGPNGKVHAIEPAELIKAFPAGAEAVKAVAAQPAYGNVVVTTPAINTPGLPNGLAAVFIRQNYHDLYDKFMGPADVPAFNRAVFTALKPGGVYVVLDHADAAGSGLAGVESEHRIDKARVLADITAAGFVLDSESRIFANPADDHSKAVFDPSIRGKSDQFLLRFKKPG